MAWYRLAGIPVLVLLFLAANLARPQAPDVGRTKADQFRNENDLEQGRRLVRANCSLCHGVDGRGGRGPSLTRGRFRRGDSDEALAKTLCEGIPERGMPPWDVFTDAERWRMVNYIQSERNQPSPQPPGDPARGQALFAKHNCAACHWVQNAGGRRGPDLSEIGRRPLEYLRSSLLDPNEQVDPAYWSVTVLTVDGLVVQGVRLNETAISLQLIDDHDQFHTFRKDELEEIINRGQSPMSSYRDILDETDLNDLISYLWTLGR